MGLIKDQIQEKTKKAGSKEAAIRDSKMWYQKSLKNLNDKNIVKSSKAFVPGKIYVFRYVAPKTKKTLEWWDMNPVVLALGAQMNLSLTWDSAKKYLEKYNAAFALRQYIPSIKANQAIVSYEHWSDIVLCDFIDLHGASVTGIINAFKKQYNNKNI